MLGEQLDVALTIPKRRKHDRENVEAVVEVVAETALPDRGLGRAIARRNDPNVDRNHLRSADANLRSCFEHPQEPDLELDRHLRDLVEKQRAARAALEVADVQLVRAGETAALMTEQLALDELWRDRAAIEREKGLFLAPAELVNRGRDLLLAGAALANQQHAGIGDGDACHQVVHALHGGGIADQPRKVTQLPQFGAQRMNLLLVRERARDVAEDGAQAEGIDGLGEVVAHAPAQRLDRGVHRGVAGDQDDLGPLRGVQVLQQFESLPVGQHQVDEDHIGLLFFDRGPCLGERAGGHRGEPFDLEDFNHGGTGVRLVVDDHGERHWIPQDVREMNGRWIWKQGAPLLPWDASSDPPRASTTSRASRSARASGHASGAGAAKGTDSGA